MKHIGTFLLILLACNLIDLFQPDGGSTILGTEYEGKFSYLIPSAAAGIFFMIFEAFYWIIVIFFY